jgi:DNA-directed RNA polymerase specialized sigma24 family protein
MMIVNKQIEIQQWKTIASGTTAFSEGERVQSSGNQQKMEKAVAEYVDIEESMKAELTEFVKTKQEIISVIQMLSPVHYDLLHMIYVQFLTFDDVADKYDKSYSWATTVHGRALKQVQKILDEREDDK